MHQNAYAVVRRPGVEGRSRVLTAASDARQRRQLSLAHAAALWLREPVPAQHPAGQQEQ